MKKFLLVVAIILSVPSISYAIDPCKYVITPYAFVSKDAEPKMFIDVDNIQMTSVSVASLNEDPLFNAASLNAIGKCTLNKHIKVANSIPVETAVAKSVSANTKDIKQKQGEGILNILIKAWSRKADLVENGLKQDVVILMVNYARSELSGFKSLKFQCAEVIPRLEDKDKEQKLLADALGRCLVQQYTRFKPPIKTE